MLSFADFANNNLVPSNNVYFVLFKFYTNFSFYTGIDSPVKVYSSTNISPFSIIQSHGIIILEVK